ncbi:fimbrial protein [Serratia ureilytica]|uniref:fimbrial protein n=1 Tax=Serratia ureilytica TaxID=300181 RepID=UPI00313D8311
MKSKIIALSVILSACSISPLALAADGTVNFTGEIIDAACTVTNDPTNPLTVNLGKVARTAFPSAGATAAPTKFTIKLTNCPATVSSAQITFDGKADNGNNEVLALTAETGVATGVGVQLTDDDSTVVPLYTASKAYPLVANQENDLNFIARYISTADSVTAGPANSTTDFTITYN